MCVNAQGDIEIGVSSDPLDDMGWCSELQQEAHHGVAEIV
jgi:hypothetical protein